MQEFIELGQRVKEFDLEAKINGEWEVIESQTTIGYKRILRFNPITSNEFRFTIKDAKGSPLISNVEFYNAPALLFPGVKVLKKEE